ncbi:MAG: LysR family transcriptional regulator [Acidobacteria bacterium]|nr:LysR family transcriptional regulator [Acidobacteriota bacterium]
MDLRNLSIFLAVAKERSFSRAAAKVNLSQPAVSQAVQRLETDIGERVFDRSSKNATLTEVGRVLQQYGEQLVGLVEETRSAIREVRELRRGHVLIGANEGTIQALLPLIRRFRQLSPDILVDVRRVPAHQIAVEVQQGSLDFGTLTFQPPEDDLLPVPIGSDELVLLVAPSHPLANSKKVTMGQLAAEVFIAHNEPSPAREHVLRLFEQRKIPLKIVLALPSLDGVKGAVALNLGLALLPRRTALTEIETGRLIAVSVAGLSRRRPILLVSRRQFRTHAADAFLTVAQSERSGAPKR